MPFLLGGLRKLLTDGLGPSGALPVVADSFLAAVKARFESDARLLAFNSGLKVYRRKTPALAKLTASTAWPLIVLNVVGEDVEFNNDANYVPTWLELQACVVDTDDVRGEDLRDAAYFSLWPNANPVLVFNGGGDSGGRVPGRRWEVQQPGNGPAGQPLWGFYFSHRFYLTRPVR